MRLHNGNITALTRQGWLYNTTWGLIDDLTMTYDDNLLIKCDDAVASQPTYNAAHHFQDLADSAVEYEYDGNGNMTKDLNRDITSIEYNSLNLPGQITFSDDTKMKFTYETAGRMTQAMYGEGDNITGSGRFRENVQYDAHGNVTAVTARWDRMDPLCEKYYGVSPYAYCGNNPMNRIDPDGRDVVIVGPLANMALLQLQERIGNDVKLFLTNDNYLCYDIVGKGNLNKSSQTLIEIIDNSDITVNITTTDKKETSSGALLVGGAFMGTNVELDANGNVVHTTAYQEVNPQVLNEADKYSSKGTFMMHELTEAYEGAKISAKKKISSPNSKGDNSVYSEAHKNATTQPAVYQRMFDKDGEQTKNPKEAQKVEWYVKPYSSSKDEHTIQNLP